MNQFEYEVTKSSWVTEDDRRLFGWEYDGEAVEEGPLVAYHVGGSTDMGGSSLWGGTTTLHRKQRHHGTRWRRDLQHQHAAARARLWRSFISNAPQRIPTLPSRIVASFAAILVMAAAATGVLALVNSGLTLEPYLGEWSGILWWLSLPGTILVGLVMLFTFRHVERLVRSLDGERRRRWEAGEEFRRRQRDLAKAEARRWLP